MTGVQGNLDEMKSENNLHEFIASAFRIHSLVRHKALWHQWDIISSNIQSKVRWRERPKWE